nr:hypothetical protein ORM20_00163 [Ochrobactrum phage ORM_20]
MSAYVNMESSWRTFEAAFNRLKQIQDNVRRDNPSGTVDKAFYLEKMEKELGRYKEILGEEISRLKTEI